MDKKKAVKLATASAVAASAFVAANPHTSQAATDVATVVSHVSQAKAQMKEAYYTYSHTVTETGQFPDIKDVYAAYNKAKQAYANAVAVVNKAGGAKKDAYLADLQATYETYVFKANPKSGEARVATYIDAYNYATKLDKKSKELKAAVDAKDLKKAEELYHKISYELKTRTVILDRVYGQTTRDLLRSQFKAEAQKLRDSLVYDITVSMKAREAQDAVKAGNLDKAKAALDQVNQYVSKVTDAFKAELQKAAQDANAAYEAALTPKVESVSAINAAQLQVKFNKAIDKSTVIDSDGTLKSGVITITKVDGTGSVTIDGTSLASLSEDGKTLTITVASGALNSMKYVVNVPENTVKATDGKYVEKYTSEVLTASDSTAPTVTKTEKLNASTVRVYFSEPLSSAGNWTFKLEDGSDAAVTPVTTNLAKGYVDLTIGSSVVAGKEITATLIGAADYANNLINPNPVTVKFTKGQLDGVKPTVTSVTPLGLNKFEIKFSEEVQDFTATDISIDGVARTADDGNGVATGTEAIVTQDSTDKTKYTVTVAPLTADIHTIAIAANAVTDLSGEQNNAYSKVVEFKADRTAPKLVSSEVKKENGTEYLYLTFDESVTPGTVNALTAKQVKDYVTTTGTIDLSGLTPVSGTDNKQYKVALNAVQFKPTGGSVAALTTGATYTVTLANFTDASGNALANTTITFNRGSDTDTNKPSIVKTFDGDEAGNRVDNNGIEVVDNDTIQVQFDRALDGATATNKANYQVNGLTVESATLLPNNIVEIKLAADTNTLSGLRNVTISGVKSKDGVLMDTFTTSEYFVENVKPYVKSATLIAPDKIKVTFSEPVQVSTVDAADLDVYVGTTKEPETGNFAVTRVGSTGSTDTDFIITLDNALTPSEYAQTLTLKVVEETGDVIADANGNLVKTGDVTISK